MPESDFKCLRFIKPFCNLLFVSATSTKYVTSPFDVRTVKGVRSCLEQETRKKQVLKIKIRFFMLKGYLKIVKIDLKTFFFRCFCVMIVSG